MQEEKKTIDIDTSGPGAEIELQEEKNENIIEQKTEFITKFDLRVFLSHLRHFLFFWYKYIKVKEFVK